jgi:hypothetical protein
MPNSPSKRSKYAEKVAAGNQMYGPGCCAHKVTYAQVEARKLEAYRSGHGQVDPRKAQEAFEDFEL